MSSTLDPEAARKALHEEHVRLNDLVVRMSESRDLEDLVAALETLHPLLRKHFAAEENPGGLYDAIGAVNAQYLAQVSQLCDEHARFLGTLRSLAARGRELLDVQQQALFAEARDLARAIHVHEGQEHALANRAAAGA